MIPLTWLYAPADRPDRVQKAYGSGADVVIIDLEDAVVPAQKDHARTLLGALVDPLLGRADPARPQPGGSPRGAAAERVPGVQVRVNGVGTPWSGEDLAAVAALPPGVGVRLPKVESVAQVRSVADRLPGRALHLLIESALGVERAYDLATCHPAVATIGLGEADLRADLGVTSDDALLWARSRLVVAAAAASLPAPAMSVWANVADLDGLRRSCERGRELGFLGRAAIHPRQLDVIRTAFTPTPAEVERAREIVAAAGLAADLGNGAVALPDGRFVDEAVVRQARRTLTLNSDAT